MLEQLKPYTTLIKIGAAVALLLGSFAFGHHVAAQSAELEAADLAKTSLENLNEQKTRVANLTTALANGQTAIAAAYQQGVKDAKDDADGTIANYKSGNLKLRKQLACTQQLLGNLPNAAATGQLDIPEGQCGLSSEDVTFLVRFAQRTNELRDQVNALVDQYNDAKAKIDAFNKGSK